MTNAIGSRASRILSAVLLPLLSAGCSSFVEVPVETPLQSKIDVTSFRRVLVAGFVTDVGESEVELGSETTRLLQNQLRSNSRLQVLEPDHPPLHDALAYRWHAAAKQLVKLCRISEARQACSRALYWRSTCLGAWRLRMRLALSHAG